MPTQPFNPNAQISELLRGQLLGIVAGTIFLFIGFTSFAIAVVRRRGGARIFVWLGIWSAIYGSLHLTQSSAVVAVAPHWFQISAPYANTALTYMTVVAGSLAFRELSLGRVRLAIDVLVGLGLAIAIAGVIFFVFTGVNDKFIPENNLLAVVLLVLLAAVAAVPTLSRKYLLLPNRGVLAVGTMIFCAEAVCVNLLRPLGFVTPTILDHVGFAVLLFSFGYSAVEMVSSNEHRLRAIEGELEAARQLQFSILPSTIPEMLSLRIAATYKPMTAVAGDFYEFLPVDECRAGFFIADVSGHGVPAALIASMIKVAVQTVAASADRPDEVLRQLGEILHRQLRGQFVSAAYLWMDTETCNARYSAAGHPPLLCWRQAEGVLTRIESNGLLFGVLPGGDYPVCDIPFSRGDRFLLYTDGVVEPENAAGEAFGDNHMEHVIHESRSVSPSELSERVLAGVRAWQPPSATQHDDITLIVVDVI